MEKTVVDSSGMTWMYAPDSGDGAAATTNPGWKRRQEWVFKATTKGTFFARVPLIRIFGLCENFSLFSRYTLEFSFVRGGDYVLFHSASSGAKEWACGFESVRLVIPLVKPTQLESLKILKNISTAAPYFFSFRRRSSIMAPLAKGLQDYQLTICNESIHERPMYMCVAFQDANAQDQTDSYSQYKPFDIDNIFIRLNNVQFPQNLMPADFNENNPGRYYQDMMDFRANYLQYPYFTSALDIDTFMERGTVFTFDLTKNNEFIMSTSVVCELHVHFATVLPDNVKVYCCWCSDRTLQLFEDGSQMKLVKTPLAIV